MLDVHKENKLPASMSGPSGRKAIILEGKAVDHLGAGSWPPLWRRLLLMHADAVQRSE
jgi:hypothetical protein